MFGGLASSAQAAIPYTLNLSAPASATAGKPFVITASGTDPLDQGARYLEIDQIPASVPTTCPTGYLDGSQLAASTGGSLVALSDRETPDLSGSFSMPIGFTPSAPGGYLFFGYTDD